MSAQDYASVEMQSSSSASDQSDTERSTEAKTPEQIIAQTIVDSLETPISKSAQPDLTLVEATPEGNAPSCTIQELTPLSLRCQALIASAERSKFFPLLKCLETVQQSPMNPNAIVETKTVCEKLQTLFPSGLEERTK